MTSLLIICFYHLLRRSAENLAIWGLVKFTLFVVLLTSSYGAVVGTECTGTIDYRRQDRPVAEGSAGGVEAIPGPLRPADGS